MTNEEYRKEQSKRFDQRYGWVDEYNREVVKTAQNWLGEYLGFHTEDKVVEVPEATVEFIDKARDLIFQLLYEINRNKAERFKSMPVYAVHVPHTKDEYYYKYDGSLSTTDSIDYYLKRDRDWELKNSTEVLFTEDEIKYWGLEGCEKTLVHQ